MRREFRTFSGRMIGYIEEDSSGKIVAHEFSGKIIGYYDPKLNATLSFSGKIVTKGQDATVGLIYNPMYNTYLKNVPELNK